MKTVATLINIHQADSGQSPHEVALNAGVDWVLYQHIVAGDISPGVENVSREIGLIRSYLKIPRAAVKAAMADDLVAWWDLS